MLVIAEIPPTDYKIQKTPRSTPIIVHVNKLKVCNSKTPPVWINVEETTTSPNTGISATPTEAAQPISDFSCEEVTSPETESTQQTTAREAKVRRKQRHTSPQDQAFFEMEDAVDAVIRARRDRRPPKYLDDFDY